MKERLVEEEKSIFNPISNSNIKTTNEMKKCPKNNFISERGQIGVWCYCSKASDLHEAISHPITSLPLSIASLDSSLYQSDKAGF